MAEAITQSVTTALAHPLDTPAAACGTSEPAVVAPPARYRPALVAYITLIVGAFVALEVFLVHAATTLRPTNIGAFGFFTGLAVLAGLRPLSWLGPSKKCEISTSWTFLLCLFLSAPIPTAAAAMFCISLLNFTVRRRPILLSFCNASVGSLALMISTIAVTAAGSWPNPYNANGSVDQRWVVGAVAVGSLGNLLDLLIASIGAALRLRVSCLRFLRNAFANIMATDAMPIGLDS